MNGTTTENAEQLVMPAPPMPEPALPEPKEEGAGRVMRAEEGGEGVKSAPSAFKPPVFKKTRKHEWGTRVGRPSNEALAKRAAENEAARIAALPPGSPGKGWGGARKGAGKPKTGKSKVPVQVRISREIKAKLNRLPKRTQTKYLDKALELMLSIEPPPEPPPEKEIAESEEQAQSDPAIVDKVIL